MIVVVVVNSAVVENGMVMEHRTKRRSHSWGLAEMRLTAGVMVVRRS